MLEEDREAYEEEIEDLTGQIRTLERKNYALVEFVKTFVSDAEFLLRKIRER